MEEHVASLKAWEAFYLIVGTTAGALTGLQFVVMTLIAGRPGRNRQESIAAFGTPNVVHFCAALLMSAILTAPWAELRHAGLAVALGGLSGVIYTIVVLRRAMRQSGYKPVGEDWLWHVGLPMLAYAALLVAGLVLGPMHTGKLFFIAGATMMLVFIGIHNAWDTIIYITTEGLPEEREETPGEPPSTSPQAPPPPPAAQEAIAP